MLTPRFTGALHARHQNAGIIAAIASTISVRRLPSLTMQRTAKRSLVCTPNSSSVVAPGFRKAEARAALRA